MSPTPTLFLDLSYQGQLVSTLKFNKARIVIGRKADADLKIEDPTVSLEHLSLHYKDGQWLLEDTSRNGSLDRTGKLISTRLKVSEDQKIRVSRLYEIGIRLKDQNSGAQKTIPTGQSLTQVLRVEGDQVVTAKAMVRGPDRTSAMTEREIDSLGISIGKHEANDWVVDARDVSGFHAKITYQQGQYVLTDLNSRNGTFVDGIRIERAHLRKSTRFSLGSVPFEFVLNEQTKKIEALSTTTFMGMVSQSEMMRQTFALTEVVAATDSAVFITGESGTGKELMAQAIHKLSPRYQAPFIALNCAALPKDLVESELFGHEKGAFTHAVAARAGAFEEAHQGSLFLDEVAELELPLQAKLLRVLESGEVKRIGANRVTHVSVRVICATHKDLKAEVENGNFREDLYYRLHVIPIPLPPLRDRLDDLPLLIPHLFRQLKVDFTVTPEALNALKLYDYPGNIRELKNILQRAVINYHVNLDARANKNELTVDHFRFLEGLKSLQAHLNAQEEREKAQLIQALKDANNNQSAVARRLDIPISTLHDRLRRYGITRPRRAGIDKTRISA
jgi:DNA-binding NtrC family response regulator/pSer/pThr/pTyr-binding forkhead associated (FHA) protein